MNTKFFAVAAAALSFAAAPIAHSEELTISAWGGFFEETLAEVVYPGFTEATGIKVNSIPQPADQAWLTQIANAARAKQAPADLSSSPKPSFCAVRTRRCGLSWTPPQWPTRAP